MDSYEAVMTHVDIISEAERGCWMRWDDIYPQIKHNRITVLDIYKRYFADTSVMCEKLRFLGTDIDHYYSFVEYRQQLRRKFPSFAIGLRNLQDSYRFKKDLNLAIQNLIVIISNL